MQFGERHPCTIRTILWGVTDCCLSYSSPLIIFILRVAIRNVPNKSGSYIIGSIISLVYEVFLGCGLLIYGIGFTLICPSDEREYNLGTFICMNIQGIHFVRICTSLKFALFNHSYHFVSTRFIVLYTLLG